MVRCSVGRPGVGPDGLRYDHETWNQDQFYDGEFFRNAMHGQGTYTWRNSGVHEGGFYSNQKEGYALLSLPDNSQFEGLFIRNEPFGPGILTYSNGRQDAGFWMGSKLVRLSRPVDFIIPRLAPTSAAKIKLLQFRRLIPLAEDDHDSGDEILAKYGFDSRKTRVPYSTLVREPRSLFFDKLAFEKAYFGKIGEVAQEFNSGSQEWDHALRQSEEEEEPDASFRIVSHFPCSPGGFAVDYDESEETDTCNEKLPEVELELGLLGQYTKNGTLDGVPPVRAEEGDEAVAEDEEADGGKPRGSVLVKIVAWNRSELCTEMLKQIFRHRAFEEKLNFKIAKLMLGARTAFRKTGEKERQCLQFLKLCFLGPPSAVKEFLCSHDISEELMDGRGNSGVMFAAVGDQLETIDLLLDHGGDVNTFNDESLTPLNLCLLRRLAQSNGISNWESAFLPSEVKKTWEEDPDAEEWPRESIPSLDRILGDGTSLNDSVATEDPQSDERRNTGSLQDFSRRSDSDTDVSEVTKLNLSRVLQEIDNDEEDTTTTPTYSVPPRVGNKLGTESIRKYEESLRKSAEDKYLFDLRIATRPPADKAKKPAQVFLGEVDGEEESELTKKIREIDRTIQKLLQRGADPNISEVPKPSIHLGVYTKDLETVRNLLLYGASPDCQLYPNEGLLTPLHVLALTKPAPEFVAICDLLLRFGANPAEETVPEFSICEDEGDFLDLDYGRTPLQLLCMRPDLEYVDPNGHLISIALLLAKASNGKRRYKGYSCLTLAMLRGNVKLLKAFLQANVFDVNEALGRDLGTALHVLVSTYLQKKTLYDTSIKMCDLLLEAGADPLKKFKSPQKLLGTCIDYGYREIEEEKNARRAAAAGKKASEGKTGTRDHLKDHVKVVEYLGKKIQERQTGLSPVVIPQASFARELVRFASKHDDYVEMAKTKSKSANVINVEEKNQKLQFMERTINISLEDEEEEGWKQKAKDKQNREKKEGNVEKEDSENKPGKKERDEGGKEAREGNVTKGKENKGTSREENKGEGEKAKEGKERSKAGNGKEKGDGEKAKGKKGQNGQNGQNEIQVLTDQKELRAEGKKKKKNREEPTGEKAQVKEDKSKHSGKLGDSKRALQVKKDSSKNIKLCKSISGKYVPETFPETLRQSLLHMFGTCADIDVNQFLLPYVVLRDGDLYYRFYRTATQRKEQYSLI